MAPSLPHPTPEATVPEEPELRFCPEDGYILARFHVGSSHPFMIDQCRNCSGVWLDGGEWEALQAGGLSNRMHLILPRNGRMTCGRHRETRSKRMGGFVGWGRRIWLGSATSENG